MKRILIDTNFYSAFKRNIPESVETVRVVDTIYISPVVMAELYSGFKLGSKEEKNVHELTLFLESPRVEVLPITEVTSLFFANIHASLKKKGTPLPTNDIWIAASAMEHGLMLVSFDIHFDSIEGLLFKKFRLAYQS